VEGNRRRGFREDQFIHHDTFGQEVYMKRDHSSRALKMQLAAIAVGMLAGAASTMAAADGPQRGEVQASSPLPVINQDAKAVVDRALAAYRGFSSYSDRLVSQKIVKGNKSTGEPLNETYPPSETFTGWRAGGAFKMTVTTKSGRYGLSGDGRDATIWFDLTGEDGVSKQHYVQVPFAERAKLPEISKAMKVLYKEHPMLWEVGGFGREAFLDHHSLISVRSVERYGIKGKEVTGTCWSGDLPDVLCPLTMFFADDTGLLVEAKYDETQMYNEHYEGKRVFQECSHSLRIFDVRTNFETAEADYTFKADAGATKLARFNEWSDADPAPPSWEALIGTEAPAWTAKDFAGADVSLSDFKGRVVVMDFWASWCGPCIAALPAMEQLRQKYEPQGVVFLGMNEERNDAGLAKAKSILEDKGIKIRQIASRKSIAKEYRAFAIPHLVVVDPAGKVSSIESGFGSDTKAKLEAQLDKLMLQHRSK
jgi:thiol-disulfide isomerase/thioredoxin